MTPTCPTCALPAYSAHDHEDCIAALRSRLALSESAHQRAKRAHAAAEQRAEEWRLKAMAERRRVAELERGSSPEARITRLAKRIAEMERRIA
jgi:hypothetical protein